MRRVLSILAIVPLLLVACGDDDTDVAGDALTTTTSPTSPTTSPTTSTSSTTSTTTAPGGQAAPPPSIAGPVNRRGVERLTGNSLEMVLDDFYFDPTFVQTSEGATFTVRLQNEGSVRHTFTISEANVDQVLEPGQETEVRVTLPSRGPVVFICRFHEGQGMRGAFYFG